MSNVSYDISNPSSTSESSAAGIFVSISAITTEFIVPIRFSYHYNDITINLNAEKRHRRSSWNIEGLWRVRVLVVADQTMMWHYDNEEHVLYMYIKTLMEQVANIFRFDFIGTVISSETKKLNTIFRVYLMVNLIS